MEDRCYLVSAHFCPSVFSITLIVAKLTDLTTDCRNVMQVYKEAAERWVVPRLGCCASAAPAEKDYGSPWMSLTDQDFLFFSKTWLRISSHNVCLREYITVFNYLMSSHMCSIDTNGKLITSLFHYCTDFTESGSTPVPSSLCCHSLVHLWRFSIHLPFQNLNGEIWNPLLHFL